MPWTFHSPAACLASFLAHAPSQPALALISGERGIGKTRWCLELLEQAARHGLKAAGLVSPAVFIGGHKVGIDLLNVASGERRRLAVRRGAGVGVSTTYNLVTSDWELNAQTLAWGNDRLKAMPACDLMVFDEAGPLELEHGGGLAAGLERIDARPAFPVFAVVRPSLLALAQRRWPWAHVIHLQAEGVA